jgi:hypothetical protein
VHRNPNQAQCSFQTLSISLTSGQIVTCSTISHVL